MLCGFLLVDKAPNQTSMDVVRIVRRVLSVPQAGHLGTLDPFASGLLPILLGGATRMSEYVIDGYKEYIFSIFLGKETDTLDVCGIVIKEAPVPSNAEQLAKNAISTFMGDIEQIPPVYSALKMNGLALYEHMRASGSIPNPIETKKRTINIRNLEFMGMHNAPTNDGICVQYKVLCSKGTYVRSLARDIAAHMGTVGYCAVLRREFIDPWHVREAVKITKSEQYTSECFLDKIMPVENLCPNFPNIELLNTYESVLASGNSFTAIIDNTLQDNSKQFSFITAGKVKFLAEISAHNNTEVFIQPRKRLC